MVSSLQSVNGSFAEKRAALMTAFCRYDEAAKSEARDMKLAVAEHEILVASQDLAMELTSPGDFALDVWLMGLPRHCAILLAIEMRIFDNVTDSISIDELSEQFEKADKALLHRVMRILTSLGIFNQTADERYHSTKFSRKLMEPSARDWIKVGGFMNPPVMANMDALKKTNYRTPANPHDAGVGLAYGGSLFEALQKDEKVRSFFDVGMAAQDDLPKEQHPDTTFPYAKFLDGSSNETIAFVDVGGGNGHVIQKIQSKSPEVKGRFVLLELPNTIADVEKNQPPFDCVVADFFKDIPVKGAQVYHIRRCLHDWDDENCEWILKNIRNAMTPGHSRLLIHEFVLPKACPRERRSHLLDIVMMALSGRERDENEWQQLLERSGLRLAKLWRAEIGDMAIIEADVA